MTQRPLTEPSFVVGKLTSDHVAVEILRRERADDQDYWDGNWVVALISFQVGAFRGRYEANLRTEEIARFKVALDQLHRSLSGDAKFESMEEQLTLTLSGDGRGHVEVSGELCDMAGTGNTLRFHLPDYDQTELPALLRQLGETEAKYEVRGKP